MIQEAYCSKEVSELLKEKGFNEPTWTCYVEHEIFHYDYTSSNSELIDEVISAPTHQMAIAWLREIHGIDIIIKITNLVDKNRRYYSMIWDRDNNSYIVDLFDSYEETEEAALKSCLENLI